MFDELFREIDQYIPHASQSAKSVSKRGVDWHLNHTLKVIISICKAIKASDEENYGPRFHWIKSFILITGYIPRGKGKSPKAFNSQENVSVETLRALWQEAKFELKSIDDLHPDRFFPHPYFGDLNVRQSKKFIRIHSKHHLKIIRDILKVKNN